MKVCTGILAFSFLFFFWFLFQLSPFTLLFFLSLHFPFLYISCISHIFMNRSCIVKFFLWTTMCFPASPESRIIILDFYFWSSLDLTMPLWVAEMGLGTLINLKPQGMTQPMLVSLNLFSFKTERPYTKHKVVGKALAQLIVIFLLTAILTHMYHTLSTSGPCVLHHIPIAYRVIASSHPCLSSSGSMEQLLHTSYRCWTIPNSVAPFYSCFHYLYWSQTAFNHSQKPSFLWS